jgi:hypothetical protein
LDANSKPLEKISRKIERNPRKGGLLNALYLRASVENLPDELVKRASEVCIHFPWGSLLAAVLGKNDGLNQIRKICVPSARVDIVFSFDPLKDFGELSRLGIHFKQAELLETELRIAYRQAGFHMNLYPEFDLAGVHTSWSGKLKQNKNRLFFRIIARPFIPHPT